jgi:peptidase E
MTPPAFHNHFENTVGFYKHDTTFVTSSVAHLDHFWDVNTTHIRRAAFIPTAADRFREFGYKDYFVDQERDWLATQREAGRVSNIEELPIARMSSRSIASALKASDLIFIGGGNVQFLQEILQQTGANEMIFDQVAQRRSYYIGRCAGAIIAGPNIEPRGTFWPSLAYHPLDNTQGLSLVSSYPVPHVDSVPIMNRHHAQHNITGWQLIDEMSRQLPVTLLHDNPLDNRGAIQ